MGKGKENMEFDKDFLWGAATSAPQVEGAYLEDGRSESIWDIAPAEKIKDGSNCHETCDEYHRYKEDVAIMKKLGFKSYRFSISWPRIMPREGEINEKGIAYYRSLIGELVKNGIEPLVTIYHWDLPVWVQEKGGWLSRKIVPLFASYTEAVVNGLTDLVTYWIIMNEPQCFIMNGHMAGAHAPFMKRYLALDKLTVNCLMAFHEAAEIIRKTAKKAPKIGISMAAGSYVPESGSDEDVAKARKMSFYHKAGTMSNRWWGDPLILGKSVRAYGIYHVARKYLPKIKTKLDFIGINSYSPFEESYVPSNEPGANTNSLGWKIDGRVLYWTLRFFYERYRLPLMVTENGLCLGEKDEIADGDKVHDPRRIDFLKEYLSNLKRSVSEGIPVIGYQHWSLLDNFEWAEGYGPHFGLVRVDSKTKERTVKDSAYFYAEVIKSNGGNIE